MPFAHAVLTTDSASRYLVRLCKHWGHRFKVEFDETRGFVDFEGSDCRLEADAQRLQITVHAPSSELEELEHVVLDHLQRFAPKGEQLHLVWTHHLE